jgi:hypothetical protein
VTDKFEGAIKLVPGEIIKFGRVPFIIKATSASDKKHDFWGEDKDTLKTRKVLNTYEDDL